MSRPFNTHTLVMMALFATILSLSAYITIPLPTGAHLSLLNFVVLLIALVFPMKQSFVVVLVWLLLGSVGVPVFALGNAGVSYLVGNWGGYNFSFLLIALIVPLFCRRKYNRIYYTIVAVFAVFFIDISGAVWLMFVTKLSAMQAFLIGVLTFLPLDILKAVVVAQIVPQFKRIVALGNTIEAS